MAKPRLRSADETSLMWWTSLRSRLHPAFIVRLAILLALAAILGWLTIAVGAANILIPRPDLAVRFAPFDARVQSALGQAAMLEIGRDRSKAQEAAAFSRVAVLRDPTLAAAWRTLALPRELRGDVAGARSFYRFAERLSRRDLLTQFWLIEEAVRRNDIDAALRHYDIAMRTHAASRDILLPVLSQAADQPNIARPLAALLARRPEWTYPFLAAWAARPPSGANAVFLLSNLRSHGPLTDAQDQLQILVLVLIVHAEPREAFQIEVLRSLVSPATARQLRNGSFDTTPAATPFDWSFPATEGVNARLSIQPDQPGNLRLDISLDPDVAGAAATQVLLLQPGRYRFRAIAQSTYAPARLRVEVTCLAGAGGASQTISFTPPTQRAGAVVGMFEVPAGCVGQRMALIADANGSAQGVDIWIDDVTVSRL